MRSHKEMHCLSQATRIVMFSLIFFQAVGTVAQIPHPTSTATRDVQGVASLHDCLVAMTPHGVPLETELLVTSASGKVESPTKDDDWESKSFTYSDSLLLSFHAYRRSLTQPNDAHTLVSNGGNPKWTGSAHEHKLEPWVDMSIAPDYSPYALLWLAYTMHDDFEVLYVGHESFEGKDLIHLSIGSISSHAARPAMRREWFLDAITMLPAYSLASTPTNESPFLRPIIRISYSKYEACGIHLCPMEQTHWNGKHEILRFHLTSNEVSNAPLPANTFTSDNAK